MTELLPIVTLTAVVISLLVGIICLIKISEIETLLNDKKGQKSGSSNHKKKKKR